ncbi:MAG: hypothetical protein JNG88_06960 [Phycisphaerales bacterium]|nr:hypothetical protein [Phycisphaerales bacterium]
MIAAAKPIRRWIDPAAASNLLWRGFWALMLVAHLPATIDALASVFAPGSVQFTRIAVLSTAQTLFVLKILNVRWLRVRNCPRAWLAICIGIALLHAGAIPHDGGWFAEDARWGSLTVYLLAEMASALALASAVFQIPARAVQRHDSILRRLIELRQRAADPPPRFLLLAALPIHRPPPLFS